MQAKLWDVARYLGRARHMCIPHGWDPRFIYVVVFCFCNSHPELLPQLGVTLSYLSLYQYKHILENQWPSFTVGTPFDVMRNPSFVSLAFASIIIVYILGFGMLIYGICF